jgi:hypothetical protein
MLIWSRFEHHFDPVSFKCSFNLLLWYQSCSNFVSNFHKLNVGPYGFIFLLQNNIFSYVHIKNYFIF